MPSLRELFQNIDRYDKIGGILNYPTRRLLEALVEAICKLREERAEAAEPEDTDARDEEARVEARDPDYIPTDEEYNDARDARVRQLQKELAEAKAGRDSWRQMCESAERGLGKARGMIHELEMLQELKEPEDISPEAIRKLREECDCVMNKAYTFRQERNAWKQACTQAQRERDEARAQIAALLKSSELADARAEVEVLQAQRDLERAAVMMGKPVGPEAEAQFEALKADAEKWQLVLGMRRESRLMKGNVFYMTSVKNKRGEWDIVEAPMLHTDPTEALAAIQEESDDQG